MKIEHSASVEVTYDTKWEDVVREVAEAGIPGTARPRVEKHMVDRPGETGYDKIAFSWTTGE